MNNITKSRLLSTIIIVLLVANIATLTVFLLKNDNKRLPPPQKGAGPFNFLVKELSLDSAQVIAYTKLRDEHQKNIESYRSEIRNAKDALFELLKTSNVNDAQLQAALNNIGEKEKVFDKVVFIHFQQLRSLCTDSQKKKFDEIIQQALKMMGNGPQHQGPPPRNGQRPQHDEQGPLPPRDGQGPPLDGQDLPPHEQDGPPNHPNK